MVHRKIVHIDEEKCMGCGQCIPQCAEGALRLVNGKAKLLSEVYCDGLGACLGKCPVGAITVDEREATAFDEEETQRHLVISPTLHGGAEAAEEPGVMGVRTSTMAHSRRLDSVSAEAKATAVTADAVKDNGSTMVSELGNWPVQLTLAPPSAPFLRDAKELLVVADCVPFAYAEFHGNILSGKPLLIGCPKLDNQEFYMNRLAEVFRMNNIEEVTVVNMEVPCCFGLLHIVRQAIKSSGKNILLGQKVVTVKGELATQRVQAPTPQL